MKFLKSLISNAIHQGPQVLSLHAVLNMYFTSLKQIQTHYNTLCQNKLMNIIIFYWHGLPMCFKIVAHKITQFFHCCKLDKTHLVLFNLPNQD
jgi:hypothetical protein